MDPSPTGKGTAATVKQESELLSLVLWKEDATAAVCGAASSDEQGLVAEGTLYVCLIHSQAP